MTENSAATKPDTFASRLELIRENLAMFQAQFPGQQIYIGASRENEFVRAGVVSIDECPLYVQDGIRLPGHGEQYSDVAGTEVWFTLHRPTLAVEDWPEDWLHANL